MKNLTTKFYLILKKLVIYYIIKSTWFEKSVFKLLLHKYFNIIYKISEKYLLYFKELENIIIQNIKKSYWKNFNSWKYKKSEIKS